jgi:hypothetical protein
MMHMSRFIMSADDRKTNRLDRGAGGNIMLVRVTTFLPDHLHRDVHG